MYNCRITVKGLLMRNSKFLILKRSYRNKAVEGLWELPGGRVELSEHPNDAVIREIAEETSIDVFNPQPAYIFHINREDTKIVGITYKVNFICDDVTLSSEHNEYNWISVDDICNYKFIGNLKTELLDYFGKDE